MIERSLQSAGVCLSLRLALKGVKLPLNVHPVVVFCGSPAIF
jgi:hypothetical protein